MKKIISFLILCSYFVGCSYNQENSLIIKKVKILEILSDRILVLPYDTISNEPVYFLISSATKIETDLHVGDYISALIDTKFMMSYPGQVNAYKITVL